MFIPALKNLTALRNAPFDATISIVGVDYTGASLVRFALFYNPDDATAALSLDTATVAPAEGWSMSVSTTGGIPTTVFTIRINKSTIDTHLPWPANGTEPGATTALNYHFMATKAGVLGGAESRWQQGRVTYQPKSGLLSSEAPANATTLQLAGDNATVLVVQGADALFPLIVAAQASATTATNAAATISSVVIMIDDPEYLWAAVDATPERNLLFGALRSTGEFVMPVSPAWLTMMLAGLNARFALIDDPEYCGAIVAAGADRPALLAFRASDGEMVGKFPPRFETAAIQAPQALTLATTANSAINPAAARARTLRALAVVRNPVDLSVMASPPVITKVASISPSATETAYRVDTTPNLANAIAAFGGVRTTLGPGNSWKQKPVSVPSGTTEQHYTQRWATRTDATTIGWLVVAGGAQGYRFLIDGQYVSLTPTVANIAGGLQRINLDLSALGRSYRRADMEGFTDAVCFGVILDNGSTLQPVGQPWRIASFGDSISASSTTTLGVDGWNVKAAQLLYGVDGDLVQMSLGSTGVLNPGFFHNAMAEARLADLTAQIYHEIWLSMGVNDSIRSGATFNGTIVGTTLTVNSGTAPWGGAAILTGAAVGTKCVRQVTGNTFQVDIPQNIGPVAMTSAGITAADITAAYLAWFQAVRLRCPTQPIFVFGVLRDDTTNAVNTEIAIKAAFDTWADPNSAFLSYQGLTPGVTKLFTGVWNGSTGNARFNFADNDTHPDSRGHLLLARFIAWWRRGLLI